MSGTSHSTSAATTCSSACGWATRSPWRRRRSTSRSRRSRRFWRARTTDDERRAMYELYLRRHDRINTWDLVDRAALHVVGRYLEGRDRAPLYELARSEAPYERRTAIVATMYYLRAGTDDSADTFAIA